MKIPLGAFLLSTALFIFLTAAARAGFISSDLRPFVTNGGNTRRRFVRGSIALLGSCRLRLGSLRVTGSIIMD